MLLLLVRRRHSMTHGAEYSLVPLRPRADCPDEVMILTFYRGIAVPSTKVDDVPRDFLCTAFQLWDRVSVDRQDSQRALLSEMFGFRILRYFESVCGVRINPTALQCATWGHSILMWSVHTMPMGRSLLGG